MPPLFAIHCAFGSALRRRSCCRVRFAASPRECILCRHLLDKRVTKIVDRAPFPAASALPLCDGRTSLPTFHHRRPPPPSSCPDQRAPRPRETPAPRLPDAFDSAISRPAYDGDGPHASGRRFVFGFFPLFGAPLEILHCLPAHKLITTPYPPPGTRGQVSRIANGQGGGAPKQAF